jgi:tRNA pseudouridine(38-40) synthase
LGWKIVWSEITISNTIIAYFCFALILNIGEILSSIICCIKVNQKKNLSIPIISPIAHLTCRKITWDKWEKTWKKADDFFEQVLNFDAKLAEAYLGKLMSELRVKTQKDLKNCKKPFDDRNNCQKVMRFANDALKKEIETCIKYINDRNAQEEIAEIYAEAKNLMCDEDSESYESAAELFDKIIDYKDSEELKGQCVKKIDEEKDDYVRTIVQTSLLREVKNVNQITISILGTGFMRYMVRNIVGMLIEIGEGKYKSEEIINILNAKDRTKAGICAPANGLYLRDVYY